jgi:hypothetical protein
MESLRARPELHNGLAVIVLDLSIVEKKNEE